MPQRSNLTGLYYTKETSLKTLPGSPIWYGLEPNGYGDFGAKISTIARTPIDPSRQNKKGTITDLDANANFPLDFTRTNLLDMMQGFLYADAREWPKTAPLVGTQVPLTSVSGTQYVAASGLSAFNVANYLVLATGFNVPGNNGVHLVSAATATTVSASGLAVEASPPANAKLEVVGKQFASGDLAATYSGGVLTLTSTASALPIFIPGAWIGLGSSVVGERFDTLPKGVFRVRTSTTAALVVDDCLLSAGGTLAADAGAGKTIRMWFGTTVKNEQTSSLIKRTSYQFARDLGTSPVYSPEHQAQYLLGCVPNEMKLSIPGQNKITADLSFLGCDVEYRSGNSGDLVKAGTYVAALGEDAYNTTSDIKTSKLAISSTGSNSTPLFTYSNKIDLSINNNAKASKAIGVLGALDINYDNIEVKGQVEAYFENTDSLAVVRNNTDCSFMNLILNSAKSYGCVIDCPLVTLGDASLNVAKGQDIMIPLEIMAAQNKFGNTITYTHFDHLPL